MRREIIAMMMAGCTGLYMSAQTPSETPGPDLSGDFEAVTESQAAPQKESADWYVSMDYGGFEFELPAGLIVDKGSNFMAKASDGSFGVSMSTEDVKNTNQKTAYEMCRRLAGSLKVRDAKVEKVKYGKCNAAQATGTIEGTDVTVIVLPCSNNQITTVLLAAPKRQPWTEHFLNTLKK